MDRNNQPLVNIEEEKPVISLTNLFLLLLSVGLGAFLAAVLLPAWLPGMVDSLLGNAPKAYWYLSRGSALVAYGLLWVSMVSGVAISNKLARLWPGGPAAYELHEYTSLLGMAFGLFHAFILLGDQYIGYTMAQVLIPFAAEGYLPFWVGLGQLGFYLWLIVNLSFYVRSTIGTRTWRAIHFLSFLTFAMALIHGIVSGTDSSSGWVTQMYWISGASLLFMVIYRILANPKLPFARLLGNP